MYPQFYVQDPKIIQICNILFVTIPSYFFELISISDLKYILITIGAISKMDKIEGSLQWENIVFI